MQNNLLYFFLTYHLLKQLTSLWAYLADEKIDHIVKCLKGHLYKAITSIKRSSFQFPLKSNRCKCTCIKQASVLSNDFWFYLRCLLNTGLAVFLFFLFFTRKQTLTFHANCLQRTIYMSKPIFWKQNKKNISKCHLLELLPR